jgi:hypothetical protein
MILEFSFSIVRAILWPDRSCQSKRKEVIS